YRYLLFVFSLFLSIFFFFLLLPPPPRSPLFPYTTLFRSRARHQPLARHHDHTAGDSRSDRPRRRTGIRRRHHGGRRRREQPGGIDRKSTRLNSCHVSISYAVFCLKKKNKDKHHTYIFRVL